MPLADSGGCAKPMPTCSTPARTRLCTRWSPSDKTPSSRLSGNCKLLASSMLLLLLRASYLGPQSHGEALGRRAAVLAPNLCGGDDAPPLPNPSNS